MFKLLKRHAPPDWNLVEETPMFLTEIRLKEIDTILTQQSGRAVSDSHVQAG